MKTTFTLLSFLSISILFTACVKRVDVTPTQSYTVIGSWYVSNASANDGNGWYSINPDLPGVFDFYDNGVANYADNLGNMQGYWSSDLVSTSYYDIYGNYTEDLHNDFKVDVTASDGSYIQLSFDDISFGDRNQFIATYYDGKIIERYTFTRY